MHIGTQLLFTIRVFTVRRFLFSDWISLTDGALRDHSVFDYNSEMCTIIERISLRFLCNLSAYRVNTSTLITFLADFGSRTCSAKRTNKILRSVLAPFNFNICVTSDDRSLVGYKFTFSLGIRRRQSSDDFKGNHTANAGCRMQSSTADLIDTVFVGFIFIFILLLSSSFFFLPHNRQQRQQRGLKEKRQTIQLVFF